MVSKTANKSLWTPDLLPNEMLYKFYMTLLSMIGHFYFVS